MIKILTQIKNTLMYPFALTIVTGQSELKRIESIGKKPAVRFQNQYDGRPIMLFALYQKGAVRPDCIRLMQAAQKAGVYVVAVNTLKMKDPDSLKGLVDCYIEKFNFGRDFSSYKTGFLHIFGNGWEKTCPRLLMINDSTFFARDRVDTFLKDMMTSDVEVLGSTENFEIEYHLGSFCISMSDDVLKHRKFRRYWEKYRVTDVRPMVIYRGEMEFSKTLKKCASEASQFKALYGADRYFSEVSQQSELLEFSLKNARTSDLTGWARISASAVSEFLEARYNMRVNDTPEDALIRSEIEKVNEKVYVDGFDELSDYVNRNVVSAGKVSTETLQKATAAILTEVFTEGSHIHQNGLVLLKMGLPLVKLDGLYRGMFNVFDVSNICALLHPEDAPEFQTLIMERPYGGKMLRGWKNAAFMRGLI